jgi:hypothetical protein
METFRMPLREIRKKFTRSEIVLMGWRSQEQYRYIKSKSPDREDYTEDGAPPQRRGKGTRRKTYDGFGPEGMPDHFFDENGDFNLSKVRGEEARQYFERRLGIPMPPGISKIGYTDEITEEIKKAYGIRE